MCCKICHTIKHNSSTYLDKDKQSNTPLTRKRKRGKLRKTPIVTEGLVNNSGNRTSSTRNRARDRRRSSRRGGTVSEDDKKETTTSENMSSFKFFLLVYVRFVVP